MADPATLAIIAAAGIQSFGQISQGQAAANAASYQATIAGNNAKIASQNAAYQGAEGDANAAAKELQTRARVGAITAAQAGNGLDVNKGSAVDVRSSAAELGQLDAMTIRSNAARAAYGYQTQASSDNAQSTLDKYTAKNDVIGGYISGAGTLLSAGGNAAMKYGNFQSDNSTFKTSDLYETQAPVPVSYEDA